MNKLNKFRNFDKTNEDISDPSLRVTVTGNRKAIRIYDLNPEEMDELEKEDRIIQIANDLGIDNDKVNNLFESLSEGKQDFEKYGKTAISIASYLILNTMNDVQVIGVIKTLIGLKKYTREEIIKIIPEE